jgi:predicted peptidase
VSTFRYVKYSPAEAEANKPWPLILFLHGSGERGTELDKVKLWSPFAHLESGHPLPAFVIAPQCPLDVHWHELLDDLDGLLDMLLNDYPIDADRVLLTGFSMGGFGAWRWAQRRPGRFAALMPVGGNGFDVRGYRVSRDLAALQSLPIWLIHGARDPVIPVSGADEMAQALAATGVHFGYTRYPHAAHTEAATLAYQDPAHYDWLLMQKRQDTQ